MESSWLPVNVVLRHENVEPVLVPAKFKSDVPATMDAVVTRAVTVAAWDASDITSPAACMVEL